MAGIPLSDKLWQRHEQLVLNLFRLGLVTLKKYDTLPEDEPTLNEILFVDVRDIYHALPFNKKPIQIPIRNTENPPKTVADINEPWTRKKPDFMCTLHDQSERESSRAFKEYAIECKRLGRKTGSWDLIYEWDYPFSFKRTLLWSRDIFRSYDWIRPEYGIRRYIKPTQPKN